MTIYLVMLNAQWAHRYGEEPVLAAFDTKEKAENWRKQEAKSTGQGYQLHDMYVHEVTVE